MILQLLQEGDPFLLESTPEFLFDGQIDPELLSQDLVETMNHHGAFGLAANQCGLDMRVFVLAPLPDDDNPIICFNDLPTQREALAGLASERTALLINNVSL